MDCCVDAKRAPWWGLPWSESAPVDTRCRPGSSGLTSHREGDRAPAPRARGDEAMGDAKVKRLQQRVDDLEALAGEARALKVELSERANETRVRGCDSVAYLYFLVRFADGGLLS